jgi:hypothetical protein
MIIKGDKIEKAEIVWQLIDYPFRKEMFQEMIINLMIWRNQNERKHKR